MLTSFLGYVGAAFLAGCALPLLIQTVSDGHARGVNGWFVFLWLTGEIAMLGHVVLSSGTVPLVLNYVANVAMVGVIACFKVRS